MTNEVSLVVFDCDGTLVDSQQVIADTMAHAYQALGFEPPQRELVKRITGLSLEVAIGQLSPKMTDQNCTDIAAAYRDRFHHLRRLGAIDEPLYPHVRETIQALDETGHVMGIATGKGIRGLNHVLETHDLGNYFTTLQTPDVAPGKPHPGMLENAMDATGAYAANSFMIGDTTFDIEMAVNAGVRSVGVSWGYHTVQELEAAGADRIIDSLAQLPAVIQEMQGESA